MFGVIDAARKDEFVKRAASAFESGQDAPPGGLKKFKLNGPAGLLLNDHRAGPNPAAANEVADLDLHDVASAQFAINGRIKHRAVA
jgi:hypothetical protein